MRKVKLMMHNNFFFVSILVIWKDNAKLFSWIEIQVKLVSHAID